MPDLEGFLDGVVEDWLQGWAWDRAEPASVLDVDLFIDGVLVGSVTADRPGTDLAAAGIGTGRYRWSFDLGQLDLHDGKPCEISARFEGTDVDLAGSPVQWVPVPPPELPLERSLTSSERVPDDEHAIVEKVMAGYAAAIEMQPSVAAPYQPGAVWAKLLAEEWGGYREAIGAGDIPGLAGLLRNFFRNEGISGFWGGSKMFDDFRERTNEPSRSNLMLRQYETWRRLCPDASVADLSAPQIGNPWGYVIDGQLLFEPVFEYDFQARYFRSLIADLPAPTVIEIGGGFGGLGYHILKQSPGAKYIGFDLPENTLLQAYYLACAFPQARVLTYTKDLDLLDRQTIDAHDIILLPNFMLPAVESAAADLIVNVRSLSEMPAETIAEYLRQVDRIGRLWFFHENIYKARGDELFGVPSTQFPPLERHAQVFAAISRWPRYGADSAYPCQENLFLHRSILQRPGVD